MKGLNKFEFNKDNHTPDKKYDFYQELFMKQENNSNSEINNHNEYYEKLLNKHKILGGVFFAISFASLLSLCIVYNGSGHVQKEMENNYQEVFANSLNLQPGQDSLHLIKNLNHAFSNYRTTAVINTADSDTIYYKIPSNYNPEGTPVKIEYKSNVYINDTVKFVFSGLDNSSFRKLEKKVLLEKLTNKNFPGYIVTVSEEGKSNLVATVTRNPVLDYSPIYQEGSKKYGNGSEVVPILLPELPLPPVTAPEKKMPDNKVEVDISKMPIPVFVMPIDSNGEVKEQYKVIPKNSVN